MARSPFTPLTLPPAAVAEELFRRRAIARLRQRYRLGDEAAAGLLAQCHPRRAATTPPARPAPSKSHPANEPSARDKAKAARDAATKGRRPKPEAEKSKDSDSDESKKEKPESAQSSS